MSRDQGGLDQLSQPWGGGGDLVRGHQFSKEGPN